MFDMIYSLLNINSLLCLFVFFQTIKYLPLVCYLIVNCYWLIIIFALLAVLYCVV